MVFAARSPRRWHFSGYQGSDAAHQIGQRQHVDEPQEVANGDLEELQPQALRIDHAQGQTGACRWSARASAIRAPCRSQARGRSRARAKVRMPNRGRWLRRFGQLCREDSRAVATAAKSTSHASARTAGVASSKENTTPSGVSIASDLHSRPAHPRKAVRAVSSHTPNPILSPYGNTGW